MFKYYISHPIAIDILLVMIFGILLYQIPLPYFELPDIIFAAPAIPSLIIAFESEKIRRLKKSIQFPRAVVLFIVYNILLAVTVFAINKWLDNNLIFNYVIATQIILVARITIISLYILRLWLTSKIR